MDTFDQEIIRTLELLAYKLKEFKIATQYGGYPKDEPPTVSIYGEDLEPLGMNRYGFCSILEHLEKKGYIIIDSIQDPTKFDPNLHTINEDDIINGILHVPIFSITLSDSISKVLEGKRGQELFCFTGNVFPYRDSTGFVSYGFFTKLKNSADILNLFDSL